VPLDDPVVGTTATDAHAVAPHVQATDDGGLVVQWESYDNVSPQGTRQLFARCAP
jgi:hypothetical protein